MPASVCEEVLEVAPHFMIPGLSKEESEKVICRAAQYLQEARVGGGSGGGYLSQTNNRPNPQAVADAIMLVRRSQWPTFGDQVPGGLKHIISADNGASYWELWHKGGDDANWYAVTGADPSKLSKSIAPERGRRDGEPGAYFIPHVTKGMKVDEATQLFLTYTVGATVGKSDGHGCGLCAQKRGSAW